LYVKRGRCMDLTSYIKDLVSKGYDIYTIKSGLLRYGYPEQMVDQAIYNLNHPQKSLELSKTTVLISVGVLIVLALGTYFFFFSGVIPDKLLDVTITTSDSEVQPGGFLSASIDLVNMGKQKRYDVFLKYELLNEETRKRAAYKGETVALTDTKSQNVNLLIPKETQAGSYILHVTAKYKDESAAAQSMVKVKDKSAVTLPPKTKETCSDSVKNQDEEAVDCGGVCAPCTKSCPLSCEDSNSLTIDYCDSSTGYECKHEKPAVCGDNLCSDTEDINSCPDDCRQKVDVPELDIWAQLETIKKLAQTSEGEALSGCEKIDINYKDDCLQNVGEVSLNPSICDRIQAEMQKDRCFSTVASATKNPLLCENVKKDSRRDTCYTDFVALDDFSVCDKITNEYLKNSCNTLKMVKS
jgi:hypothetical protein